MDQDPRISAYIDAAAPFARPILHHIRHLAHQACPGVEETLKWSMPAFLHKGQQFAGMAAFKAHASLHVWNRLDPQPRGQSEGMGQYGKLTALADLPPDATLIADLAAAVAAIDAGAKQTRAANTVRPAPDIPADLLEAFGAAPAAAAAFTSFPPSAQREYVDWIIEAKAAETRARRIETTIAQCAEGKRRYWKMAGR